MRRLLLMLLSLMMFFLFTSCGDKSTGPKQGEKLTKAMAVSAVSQVVKERGLYSSSSSQEKAGNMPDRISNVLGFGKYYNVDVNVAKGKVDVSFDVGSDGNIIPDGSWRYNHPDFCREKIRYIKGAKKSSTLIYLISMTAGSHLYNTLMWQPAKSKISEKGRVQILPSKVLKMLSIMRWINSSSM